MKLLWDEDFLPKLTKGHVWVLFYGNAAIWGVQSLLFLAQPSLPKAHHHVQSLFLQNKQDFGLRSNFQQNEHHK